MLICTSHATPNSTGAPFRAMVTKSCTGSIAILKIKTISNQELQKAKDNSKESKEET